MTQVASSVSFPGPGTTLADGVVYKTVPLAPFLPPEAAADIPGQYADLEFAYHTSSAPGTPVTIGQTDGLTTIAYTDASGNPSLLPVASVGIEGSNGFQFTDPLGTLWTVLDRPVADGVPLDPLFAQAIKMESANPSVAQLLQTLQSQIDLATGGQPIVFQGNPVNGNAPCFARGTLIRTVAGDVAVEDLATGDRVVLATGGDAEVVWIGRRRVRAVADPAATTMAPVRIAAGALGHRQPERPLRLSPDHALLLDGVLVAAGLLVNGSTIVREGVETVEYFHVELPAHAVLIAEGAAAESYLDTGNRAMFANAPIVEIRPDLSARTPCAEMVLAGEHLDRIRAALPPALRVAC